MTVNETIKENRRRRELLQEKYDPISGDGSHTMPRVRVEISDSGFDALYLPERMTTDEPFVQMLIDAGSFQNAAKALSYDGDVTYTADDCIYTYTKIRIQYDFEFWAALFVKIKVKAKAGDSGRNDSLIPFVLNRGQRKYFKILYDLWIAGTPIRIILLKARQWGGSTLTQIFMMWIQMVHRKRWNSVICAHVEQTAREIQGMYTRALANYPAIYDDDATGEITFTPYMGSVKTRTVSSRECTITIGSAERPESLRGQDISMAHFSEVSSFPATDNKTPEDVVQSIASGIASARDTIIVYESTAKGVGNFMHREWVRAKKGGSAFVPVFVAWYEIDYYEEPIEDYATFIESMSEWEMQTFAAGATLEALAWYRKKRKEYAEDWRMMSEYPSNDIEAFQSTGQPYFNMQDVERLRRSCMPPAFTGDVTGDDNYGKKALNGIRFKADSNGKFKVWELPDDINMRNHRYVVVVDVNRGTSTKADNGIICVFDRYWMKDGGVPEVVAEWAGHIDMRYFIWKAVQIAKLYNDALLVVESNTPDSIAHSGFEMESIFDEIADVYPNLYSDTPPDKIIEGVPLRYGFRTTRASKLRVCSFHQVVISKDMYIERNMEAVDEHQVFEYKDNGALGAKEGCHDDRLITRAIGVWVCYDINPPALADDKRFAYRSKTVVNESTI